MSDSTYKTLAAAAAAGAAGAAITGFGAALDLTDAAAIWPVMATCAVVGGLLQSAKSSLGGMVDNRTRTLRERLEDLRRSVGDIHGLVRIQPLAQQLPLPIGGGWALTGDAAAVLVREAQLRKPRTILELGSGVSTLLLGQVLRNAGGGRLVSIDHDAAWAARTRENLKLMGLEDVVSVVDAPLRTRTVGEQRYDWYDIPDAVLDELGPIDLLLVDGPPQRSGDTLPARFPALPVLGPRLSDDALVFVDDADRAQERTMVQWWLEQDAGWKAERHPTVDGVCLLRRT
ncbi:O-methyltransferase [Rubrivivax gelatinosus]|uniref:Putative O-methyltransferase YrrM n=1 Tax=Rubrivivax gelatinosus TaxID=28068 RepID=A0A4R2MLA3_RUBGE|nr:class I SAM-dependent methyltransferase [Rubrivivax gelatinosus]MBK1686101.1 hypothetical protein [Rubrivivax gelatinosus]TCP05594.1 putative O-methyltransferase YrrM [Rubrivivax gelatinosus]